MNRTANFLELNRTTKFLYSLPDGGFWSGGIGILTSPVLAFHFAQVWERAKMEEADPFEVNRSRFADCLHSLTQLTGDDHPMTQGRDGSSMKAQDAYFEVISRLLKQWRACDQDPVRWWTSTDNQEEVRLVQRAVASTIFSLRLERSTESIQPKPVWSWMAGESLRTRTTKRESAAALEEMRNNIEGNAPLRVVKSMPLLREKRSLIKAARTMAYLLFSEVLVQRLRVEFCSRCDGAFLLGKKQKYCSEQCAHVDSGLQTKSKTTRKLNRDRVREASKAIAAWLDSRSRRDWRRKAENALTQKSLIHKGTSKSQWLGRCIRAAGSEGSPQRARLAELCTVPGASAEEIEKVSKDLITFYDLIRQAQCRENRK
jgi:hypothetical protein